MLRRAGSHFCLRPGGLPHEQVPEALAHQHEEQSKMFSQLRDRVAAKLRDLGPQDELDKAISAVVDRGTAETLQAPDWSANMELVDVVNRNPE